MLKKRLLVSFLLVLFTVVLFARVHDYEFVGYDDNWTVTENVRVKMGLSWNNFVWALTTDHAATWQPVTWLSHMAAIDFFGNDAGGHHLINVVFQAANVALLFLFISVLTNTFWPAVAVAWLFAIHPQHVETVCWVASRKDVVCMFFMLLSFISYVYYRRQSGRAKIALYFSVALTLVLAHMSKPMAISMPFLMLFMDFWPLGVLNLRKLDEAKHLFVEKIPFFAMAVCTAVAVYVAQSNFRAPPLEVHDFGERAANAMVSFWIYLYKTFVPIKLAVLYPFPMQGHGVKPIFAVLGIMVLVGSICWFGRKRPWLLMGSAWYLVSFFPMMGWLPIGGGNMAMGDRYIYLPHIGLFIALVWGGLEVLEKLGPERKKPVAVLAGVLVTLVFGTLSWVQVGHWKNSQTLSAHAAKVTEGNYSAYNNLATTYLLDGDYKTAETYYNAALNIRPHHASSLYNMGLMKLKQQKWREGIPYFKKALKTTNFEPDALYNMAYAQYQLGDYVSSQKNVTLSLKYRPGFVKGQVLLSKIRRKLGDDKGANQITSHMMKSSKEERAKTNYRTAMAVLRDNKREQAKSFLKKALQLDPGFEEARKKLAELEGR